MMARTDAWRAVQIAKGLGARCAGANSWIARCPAHDDRMPSLSITVGKDGKVLVCCHAGCTQQSVIDALDRLGLWDRERRRLWQRPGIALRVTEKSDPDQETMAKREYALKIWGASSGIRGTLAERYLRGRGLSEVPERVLRYHRGLKHPAGEFWPGMVALVEDGETGTPIAIHRTYLRKDGWGKAPVEPAKMMLGSVKGGAVRLGEPGRVLMVGEGIETCLAAQQAMGIPAFAALSTSGLRALDLPREVQEVIVLADGDDAGEAAAQHAGRRWQREGRSVRIARPPRGMDFNDLLQQQDALKTGANIHPAIHDGGT